MHLLDDVGYESLSEVTFRLDSDYEPVPDVIAVDRRGTKEASVAELWTEVDRRR